MSGLVETREIELSELREQIKKGEEAKRLISDPVLVAWWEDCQCKLLDLVDTVLLNDTVARDRIYTMLTLVRKMKQSFESYVENGEYSEKEYARLLELEKKGLLGGMFG